MPGLEAWLAAFVFTQLVEIPIYAVALRARLPVAFGASAITHPIVWFVIFPFVPLPYLGRIVLAESFAVVAEAMYFRLLLGRPRVWPWALAANAASFGTGLLSRWLFGVP
jgi:hypothetical protein